MSCIGFENPIAGDSRHSYCAKNDDFVESLIETQRHDPDLIQSHNGSQRNDSAEAVYGEENPPPLRGRFAIRDSDPKDFLENVQISLQRTDSLS